MKKRHAYVWLVFCFLLFYGFIDFLESDVLDESQSELVLFPNAQPISTQHFDGEDDFFTIGMWNLKVFGATKASNESLLLEYVDIISAHDVFIVQEIRNKDGRAFESLCNLVYDLSYDCFVSSRAGSSNSKEQYGFIYKTHIILHSVLDWNPNKSTVFERPPFEATFEYNSFNFTVGTIHMRPSNVDAEFTALEKIYLNSTRTILLGDFNADCTYYEPGNHFLHWGYVISSDSDTTVSSTDCAYDRIMLSTDLFDSYDGIYGITTENVRLDMSDHYPVWFSLLV